MRLDAFVSKTLHVTRKEAKRLIEHPGVYVNGQRITRTQTLIDEHHDAVVFRDQPLHYQAQHDYLYHKPKGVVVAHRDGQHPTIFDDLNHTRLPATLNALGRLDKDTTGLLILSTDGAFIHQLMHGKHTLGKTYDVTLNTPFTESVKLLEPMTLIDGKGKPYQVKTPTLHHVEGAQVRLTIYEGKTHQIKKMFHALGYEVLELHRHAIGSLCLPTTLHPGELRPLSEAEKTQLLLEATT